MALDGFPRCAEIDMGTAPNKKRLICGSFLGPQVAYFYESVPDHARALHRRGSLLNTRYWRCGMKRGTIQIRPPSMVTGISGGPAAKSKKRIRSQREGRHKIIHNPISICFVSELIARSQYQYTSCSSWVRRVANRTKTLGTKI